MIENSREPPGFEEYFVYIGYAICLFERKRRRKVHDKYQIAREIFESMSLEEIDTCRDIQILSLKWLLSHHMKGIS